MTLYTRVRRGRSYLSDNPARGAVARSASLTMHTGAERRRYMPELQNSEFSSEPLTMKDTQQIALEILHTVAQICEEQKLRYYLVYGTLIGAVRHHGFIPWDDDVDIMMPRPDHDRLMEYLDDHIGEYPHLQVFNRKTCPEYPYMITRISDDRYEIRMENEKPFGMGIFIDRRAETILPLRPRPRRSES